MSTNDILSYLFTAISFFSVVFAIFRDETTIFACVLIIFSALSFATLDKGKHDKQQKNGLSTLPKTPPGCKKGGVFA